MQDNPKPETRNPRADESIKDTIESIVIAFVLAFVFRAFVVEAFVIPTGSMAPTLLGEHQRVTCPDCGYRFDLQGPPRNAKGAAALCPMTGHPIPLPPAPAASGDRILVHKYLYRFSPPRRWDVVVFKNPQRVNPQDGSPGPKTNYIKRLVGLPGESIYLLEGNVFTAPHDSAGLPTDDFRIARKTDRPKVQQAVWRPIYWSDYVPADPTVAQGAGRATLPWQCPWEPEDPDAWDMTLHHGRSYRYRGQGDGKLRFTFAHWPIGGASAMRVLYPYNQMIQSAYTPEDLMEPIEDVRLAVTVEPTSDAPLQLQLRTTARLDREEQTLAALIDPDGQVRLILGDPDSDQAQTIPGPTVTPLHQRSAAQIEFWFVDLEASVWIDGRRVLHHPFDLDFKTLRNRAHFPPLHRPTVSLTLTGGSADLHHVRLDRDLYYTPTIGGGVDRLFGRGVLMHIGSRDIDNRFEIHNDEFFCLGDNGPVSLDGRFWSDVEPWVALRNFQQPQPIGLVPRDLMMGRAFFVYWPAPYPFTARGPGVLPNFGDMRFIH